MGEARASQVNFNVLCGFLAGVRSSIDMPKQDIPATLGPYIRIYEAERDRDEKVEKLKTPPV